MSAPRSWLVETYRGIWAWYTTNIWRVHISPVSSVAGIQRSDFVIRNLPQPNAVHEIEAIAVLIEVVRGGLEWAYYEPWGSPGRAHMGVAAKSALANLSHSLSLSEEEKAWLRSNSSLWPALIHVTGTITETMSQDLGPFPQGPQLYFSTPLKPIGPLTVELSGETLTFPSFAHFAHCYMLGPVRHGPHIVRFTDGTRLPAGDLTLSDILAGLTRHIWQTPPGRIPCIREIPELERLLFGGGPVGFDSFKEAYMAFVDRDPLADEEIAALFTIRELRR